MTKKVLILASTFPRWEGDGVPRFVLKYATTLSDSFKVKVLAPHYKGARTFEVVEGIKTKRFIYTWPFRYEDIAYGEFKKTMFYGVKAALYTLFQTIHCLYMARQKGTVINAHWLIPQGFSAVIAGKMLGRKTLIVVHGSDVFTLNGWVMNAIKRFVLKNADEVVVNSSATKAACQAIWDKREYLVIPMGVNDKLFKRSGITKKKADGFEVLFVGRLSPEKGVIYLCEAFKEFSKRHKDARLSIVGDGVEKLDIEEYIKKHGLSGMVSMKGWVNKESVLAEIYSNADVFVGPSIIDKDGKQEAFGVVFAEASLSGLPVIATNTGGIGDVVIDQETGFLIEQKRPDLILEKLELLHSDRARAASMGRRGNSYIKENFTWEVIGKKYSNIIKSL